jgi:hypothetical protein
VADDGLIVVAASRFLRTAQKPCATSSSSSAVSWSTTSTLWPPSARIPSR